MSFGLTSVKCNVCVCVGRILQIQRPPSLFKFWVPVVVELLCVAVLFAALHEEVRRYRISRISLSSSEFFFFKKKKGPHLVFSRWVSPGGLRVPAYIVVFLCLLCFETVASWHHCTDYNTTSAAAQGSGEKRPRPLTKHTQLRKLQRVGHVSAVRIFCDTCTYLTPQPSPYCRIPTRMREHFGNAATLNKAENPRNSSDYLFQSSSPKQSAKG